MLEPLTQNRLIKDALSAIETSPFAIVEKKRTVMVYTGTLHKFDELQDIHDQAVKQNADIAFVLPYRVIRERGCEAQGDEPILSLSIEKSYGPFAMEHVLPALVDEDICLSQDIEADTSDDEFAALIKDVQNKEIEGGNISQVNISRAYRGKIESFSLGKALSIYRHLLTAQGQYMTILFGSQDIETPENNTYLAGATPECHLLINDHETVMTPIAGTLRKEDEESFEARLETFVNDDKEINELYQVTDEELKMMGRICPDGGIVEGPFLREIGNVIHTEYKLIGKRSLNAIDSLRLTLHAPTMVGSPLESAARVIANYEVSPRRYYTGEFGLYHYRNRPAGFDVGNLDTAILIRTAEIFADGTVSVQAGGGIVRDSNPHNEAKESRAKASSVTDILMEPEKPKKTYLTPEHLQPVEARLQARNNNLSKFWFCQQAGIRPEVDLGQAKITIINNEDDFAYMLGHILTRYSGNVSVVDTFDYQEDNNTDDLIVIGPGPGDINDPENKRMIRLHQIYKALVNRQKSIVGICLGHQLICKDLGFPVKRQATSSQGMPKDVELFGEIYKLAFYNSFSPVINDAAVSEYMQIQVDDQKRIIALKTNKMVGYQFHPESVMSEQGDLIFAQTVKDLLEQV